jgi:hypothetical protein
VQCRRHHEGVGGGSKKWGSQTVETSTKAEHVTLRDGAVHEGVSGTRRKFGMEVCHHGFIEDSVGRLQIDELSDETLHVRLDYEIRNHCAIF